MNKPSTGRSRKIHKKYKSNFLESLYSILDVFSTAFDLKPMSFN